MNGNWVIKTTEGSGGRDYWDKFYSEGVIAIGWNDIKVRPHMVSMEELKNSVKNAYPHDAGHGARTIDNFVDISIGDRVLICRGYPPNQEKDVYIHGIATITSGFYDDADSDWWMLKHKADIRLIERNVPKALLVATLGKSSMMQTLHSVTKDGLDQLESHLR